jgi:hypothetical protein
VVAGTGNQVIAFNDTLLGGNGGDLLVGDIRLQQAYVAIDIEIRGEAGNSISAFRDSIDGGGGPDLIWGDFYVDWSSGFAPDRLDIAGDFEGRDLLFSYTIDGGGGSDTIGGGLGADVLTGGAGSDVFVWSSGDLTPIAASGAAPVDTVTDFPGPRRRPARPSRPAAEPRLRLAQRSGLRMAQAPIRRRRHPHPHRCRRDRRRCRLRRFHPPARLHYHALDPRASTTG